MIDFIAVAVLGGLVALGELVSRYRDSPRRALLGSMAAWLYGFINATAAICALALMQVFAVNFGQTGPALQWTRVLAAGFSAIAFFRSSIFTVRIGNQDMGVGPISFLQVILSAVDRAVDSRRASSRATEVGALMAGLSFEKAFVSLPAFCLALMQNLPDEDQKRLGQSIITLRDVSMPESVKLRILAAYLLNAVGPDALRSAVTSLAEDLRPDREVSPKAVDVKDAST